MPEVDQPGTCRTSETRRYRVDGWLSPQRKLWAYTLPLPPILIVGLLTLFTRRLEILDWSVKALACLAPVAGAMYLAPSLSAAIKGGRPYDLHLVWLRFYHLVAVAAVAISLLFGIAGLFHTAAVIGVAVKQGKPFDYRLASLLTTGVTLVYPAMINIGISRWIRQGQPWALTISTVATLPLFLHLTLLLPVEETSAPELGVPLCGIYLCLLLVARQSWRTAQTFPRQAGGPAMIPGL